MPCWGVGCIQLAQYQGSIQWPSWVKGHLHRTLQEEIFRFASLVFWVLSEKSILKWSHLHKCVPHQDKAGIWQATSVSQDRQILKSGDLGSTILRCVEDSMYGCLKHRRFQKGDKPPITTLNYDKTKQRKPIKKQEL